jgi:cell division septum initiation protein DivIVA
MNNSKQEPFFTLKDFTNNGLCLEDNMYLQTFIDIANTKVEYLLPPKRGVLAPAKELEGLQSELVELRKFHDKFDSRGVARLIQANQKLTEEVHYLKQQIKSYAGY